MITACPVTSRNSLVLNPPAAGNTRSCTTAVCSSDNGAHCSAITLAFPRSTTPASNAPNVGANTVVMVPASRTRIPAVTGEIRNAAATSAAANDTAASGTNSCTCSGESSPVMHDFRANRAANRIGSPATNGTANAANNRICRPVNNDNAFSDATIASTNSAPDNDPAATPAKSTNDDASAGDPA